MRIIVNHYKLQGDDFPFPQMGYVSSQEGKSPTPHPTLDSCLLSQGPIASAAAAVEEMPPGW